MTFASPCKWDRSLNLDTVARFVAVPSVSTCAIGDDLALLDLRSSTYFSLNEVGAQVWKLLETPRSLDEICAAVAGDYAVEPAVCREDVAALLRELGTARLVECDDPRAG